MPHSASRTAALLTTSLAVALALLVSPAPVAQAAEGDRAGGRMHAEDARFADGCRRYSYGYRVRTPHDDWTLELSILNPDGDAVHSHAFIGKYGRQGDRRRRAKVPYRICSNASGPGVYRIRARLEWYEKPPPFPMDKLHGEPPQGHVVRLPVERFRLRR